MKPTQGLGRWNPPPSSELGGSELEGGKASGIEVLPHRVDRYGRARRRTLEMLAYLDRAVQAEDWDGRPGSDPKLLRQRLDDCGNWLRFRHYTAVDEVRLQGASFCKQHLACALCAVRRGARLLGGYLPKYEQILRDHPGLRPELVTVTVKNGFHLPSRFAHLKECWQGLHRRVSREEGTSCLKAAGFAGAVWSYEVTNIGNGWHPHLHAVVLSRRGIDVLALSQEWHRLTQDSFVVDVRPLQPGQEPAEAFSEVFKYAVKFSDLSPRDRFEAFCVLRGRRLVGSAGVFRGVEVSEELLDDELDGAFIDYLYRYLRDASCYSLLPTAT